MFRFLTFLASSVVLLAFLAIGGLLAAFWHFGRDLPDYHQLAHYEPPVTTRVYAGDGRLVAEYAVEKRTFVPLSAMPQRVVAAFLAAEDKNFHTHPGIDWTGVARAIVVNVANKLKGADRRPEGASTITQQVAKNFLLTNEVSYNRKIKEAILALRIERAFPKNHILELYLNEIYLGFGSYGVAAAAMNYFNKGLDQLTVAEAAYLAALPKAPNNYHPLRNPQAAKERRDWVIGRLYEDGRISREEATNAVQEQLLVRRRDETEIVYGGDYFAEDIRREIAERFGESTLYKGGLVVRSTLDPKLQAIANKALRAGLIDYDRRHGWRGPITNLKIGNDWAPQLATVKPPAGLGEWRLAVVLGVGQNAAEIGFSNGSRGRIPWSEMKWARPWKEHQRLGPTPKSPADVLAKGDVVAVEAVDKGEDGHKLGEASFALRQLPKIEGALVAMDPHTGRILAMVGGFSYERSQFNRASQALRQPGSSFKPLVYLAALDSGFTPSSLVLDAPVELDQGPGLPKWKPHNYSGDFLGPTTLRIGIEKSRNLMTVRLAQEVGMPKIVDYAKRFGIVENLQPVLSMSLGAGETTPLRMTAAYAQIVNGGKKIKPTLIDRIQDRTGATIFRHDSRTCEGCNATVFKNQDTPAVPDNREQLTSPASAYQMVSIMQGVVERGTGRKIAELGRPLAGKTGTSNDSHDTWFVGFSPDLAVGVFVGFDEPSSLGDKETGGSVAAPIFKQFMGEALADQPPMPFRLPPGIRLMRVSHQTGLAAQPGDKDIIFEAFKPDALPNAESKVLGGEPTSEPLIPWPEAEGEIELEPRPVLDTRPVVDPRPMVDPRPTIDARPHVEPGGRAPVPSMGGLY